MSKIVKTFKIEHLPKRKVLIWLYRNGSVIDSWLLVSPYHIEAIRLLGSQGYTMGEACPCCGLSVARCEILKSIQH